MSADFRDRLEEAQAKFAHLPDNLLMGSLKMMAAMSVANDIRSLEEFVLVHGRAYEPTPLDPCYPQGKPRECFANALLLAMDNRELLYVEGYATRADIGFHIHHAWVTRRGEAQAIDPTWEDAERCLYWGMEFEPDYAWEVQARRHGTGETLSTYASDLLKEESQ